MSLPTVLTQEESAALASAVMNTMAILGTVRPFTLVVTDDGTSFSLASNTVDGPGLLTMAAEALAEGTVIGPTTETRLS